MSARTLTLIGVPMVLVGVILAFALDADEPSLIGVRLEPFGGIVLAGGLALLAAAGLIAFALRRTPRSAAGGTDDASTIEKLRAVAGLAAVGGGIVAVVALGRARGRGA